MASERRPRPWGGLLVLSLLPGACAPLAERRQAESEDALAAAGQRLQRELVLGSAALDAPEPSPQARALWADGLDPDEAVAVALLENRGLRASFEDLGVATYERVRAGLLPNPLLGGSLQVFDSGTGFELGLSQPLQGLFLRALRADLAEAELAHARAATVERLVRLAGDVQRAGLRLDRQRQRVQLRSADLLAARAADELTAELFAAGNVIAPERTRAALAHLEAQLDHAAAEQELVERREQFLVLLGLAEDPGFELRFEGPLESLANSEEGTEDEDLAALELQAVAADLHLAMLRARASGAARRAGLTRAAEWLEGAEAGVVLAKEPDESDLGVGPSLTLALPLFDSGAAGRAAAGAELEGLLAEHEQRTRELRSAARRLAQRATALGRQAHRAQLELEPLAHQLVVETLQQFNAMQVGAFDPLRERRAELAAALRALDLGEAADLARLDLAQLLAGAFEDSLLDRPYPDRSGAAAGMQSGGH
jgi:cobalt-zinc-cadmium efflux system outer membrane protein